MLSCIRKLAILPAFLVKSRPWSAQLRACRNSRSAVLSDILGVFQNSKRYCSNKSTDKTGQTGSDAMSKVCSSKQPSDITSKCSNKDNDVGTKSGNMIICETFEKIGDGIKSSSCNNNNNNNSGPIVVSPKKLFEAKCGNADKTPKCEDTLQFEAKVDQNGCDNKTPPSPPCVKCRFVAKPAAKGIDSNEKPCLKVDKKPRPRFAAISAKSNCKKKNQKSTTNYGIKKCESQPAISNTSKNCPDVKENDLPKTAKCVKKKPNFKAKNVAAPIVEKSKSDSAICEKSTKPIVEKSKSDSAICKKSTKPKPCSTPTNAKPSKSTKTKSGKSKKCDKSKSKSSSKTEIKAKTGSTSKCIKTKTPEPVKCSKSKSSESIKTDKSKSIAAPESTNPTKSAICDQSKPIKPTKPANCKPPMPVEPPKCEKPKPVEPAKCDKPKPVEPPKCDKPKPVEPAKCGTPKPVETPKCDKPKPVEPPKCDKSKPVEPAKCDKPKPVEPAKCGAPKPVEPPKCDKPKPVEPAKCGAPKLVEPPKCDKPKPVEPPKCDKPKPVEPAKCSTPKPVEPPKCDKPKPKESAKCGKPKATKPSKCDKSKSKKLVKCPKPKSAKPKLCGKTKTKSTKTPKPTCPEPAKIKKVEATTSKCDTQKPKEPTKCEKPKTPEPKKCEQKKANKPKTIPQPVMCDTPKAPESTKCEKEKAAEPTKCEKGKTEEISRAEKTKSICEKLKNAEPSKCDAKISEKPKDTKVICQKFAAKKDETSKADCKKLNVASIAATAATKPTDCGPIAKKSGGTLSSGRPCGPGGPQPPQSNIKMYRNISLATILLVMVFCGYTFLHIEHKERAEFKPYEHLRRRNKRFPWGDGQKSFFHNPECNALPDGYEDEADDVD